ncbi:MAG: transaldolase family protein [Christensenellales bacterium]|jgi:transaldolase
MRNYLEWLAEETPTKWWHDSAIPQEIDQAIAWGALGVTTNPVLTYKSFEAAPEFWQPQIDKIPADLPLPERAEALLKIVAQYAAEKFLPIYDKTQGLHGYALGQLNPGLCSSSEKMLEQALRYVSWGENIAVKLPTVKAALPVIEELAARGIAVCTTLNFSVSQALSAAMAYERGITRAQAAGITIKPCFVVQQGGRLDDYLMEVAQDNGIDVSLEDLHEAGNAVCKKSYTLYRQRGYRATIMPAGLRGVHHLAALAGGDMVFSLQSRIQKMVLAADLPQKQRINETIDQQTLCSLSRIPEFVRAYATDGVQPEEFISFGVTQKTLSQFLWTGWAPLETYGTALKSDRWF